MRELTAPLRVLLVDDDPDDRFLIGDLLEHLGAPGDYLTETASSYDEALTQLSRHAHDVVLVDFQLGVHTGADLLIATAGDARRPPMIVLTGHSSVEIDRLCLQAGAADFLVKAKLDGESLGRSLRYAVERHRLSSMLAERESEYRTLFDASPMPMWLYDPDSLRILQVNDAAVEQYGYSREEFLVLRTTQLHIEADRERFPQFQGEHSDQTGHFYAGVWQHQCRDGRLIDVDIVRSSVLLGDSTAYLVLAYNVSSKLRAEAALRASEATLRQVLRDAFHGLLVVGADDLILFANPIASRVLKCPEDELIGTVLPEVLRGTPREIVELRDEFDAIRQIDLHSSPTHWLGAPARVLILHDVTAQRANARQLLLLSRAIESTNDGLVIVDVHGRDQPVTYVNPAFERITGYPAAEIVGRNCRLLQGDDHDQEGLVAVREALVSERDCTVELRNYRKDGSLLWNRLTLSPVLRRQPVQQFRVTGQLSHPAKVVR